MSIAIEKTSVSAVYLESFFAEERLQTATSFFFQFKDQAYLISNWHIFSGRSRLTGQAFHKAGVVPNRLKICFRTQEGLFKTYVDIPLYDSDGEAIWLQHPAHGQNVDIGAIKVEIPTFPTSKGLVHPSPVFVNGENLDPGMIVKVSSDVFIIGFPLGILKTDTFPIWKKGTVASEFDVKIDGLDSFFVDSATRAGMSGSPVFARSQIGHYDSIANDLVFNPRPSQRFLGIYSGRQVGASEEEAQLGLVWKTNLIDEVCASTMRGTYELKG